MKKVFGLLLVFSCCTGVTGDLLAANECSGEKSITMSSQKKWDDEFLYYDQNTYDSVPDKNEKQSELPNFVYECDRQKCGNESEVTLPKGHVFKGSVINEERTYVCRAAFMGDDRWVVKSVEGVETTVGKPKETYEVKCEDNYAINLKGNQRKHDDEFLYENKSTYDMVIDHNNKYQQNLPGMVYECDKQICANGFEVDMEANHVFKGQVVKEKTTYVCDAKGNNKWVVKGGSNNGGNNSGNNGGENSGKKCGVNSVQLAVSQRKNHNEFLYENKATYDQVKNNNRKQTGLAGKVYECDKQICGDNEVIELNANHVFQGKLVTTKKKYICKVTGSGDYWEEVSIKGADGLNACLEERTTPEGDACCYLAPSVAKFEKGECVCSGGKTFRMDMNGRGICTGGNEDDVSECAEYKSDYYLYRQCAFCKAEKENGAFWDDKSKICSCIGEANKDKEWNTEIGECVAKGDDLIPVTKLVTAAEKLDTIFAGFKVSKWKNEEGKFNTARLASDSIAGVVLGTTGGLITSSVMKKKQVEQGFEDLQCVVGGQPVAGWGDEFMVGIQ